MPAGTYPNDIGDRASCTILTPYSASRPRSPLPVASDPYVFGCPAQRDKVEAKIRCKEKKKLTASIAKSSSLKGELERKAQLLVEETATRKQLEKRCVDLEEDVKKAAAQAKEFDSEAFDARVEVIRLTSVIRSQRGNDILAVETAYGNELQRVQDCAKRESITLQCEVSAQRAARGEIMTKLNKACKDRDSWREDAEALEDEINSLRETWKEAEANIRSRAEEKIVAAVAQASALEEELKKKALLLEEEGVARQQLEKRCFGLEQDVHKSAAQNNELENEALHARAELGRVSGVLRSEQRASFMVEMAYRDELHRVQEYAKHEAQALTQETSLQLEEMRGRLNKACGDRDFWSAKAEAHGSESKILSEIIGDLRKSSEKSEAIDDLLGQISCWERRTEELARVQRDIQTVSPCDPHEKNRPDVALAAEEAQMAVKTLEEKPSSAPEEAAVARRATAHETLTREAVETRLKDFQKEVQASAEAPQVRRGAKVLDIQQLKIVIQEEVDAELDSLQGDLEDEWRADEYPEEADGCLEAERHPKAVDATTAEALATSRARAFYSATLMIRAALVAFRQHGILGKDGENQKSMTRHTNAVKIAGWKRSGLVDSSAVVSWTPDEVANEKAIALKNMRGIVESTVKGIRLALARYAALLLHVSSNVVNASPIVAATQTGGESRTRGVLGLQEGISKEGSATGSNGGTSPTCEGDVQRPWRIVMGESADFSSGRRWKPENDSLVEGLRMKTKKLGEDLKRSERDKGRLERLLKRHERNNAVELKKQRSIYQYQIQELHTSAMAIAHEIGTVISTPA